MRWPPPVRVSLAPSPMATLLIAMLAIGTCLVVATLPFPPLTVACAGVGIVLWAINAMLVVGLRRGRRAVRGFELRGDLTIIVTSGDGMACAGRVHVDSYVGARLSTIVWRPFGRWRARTIVLLPDMLPAVEFRRLRVLLRYARSDVEQGAPASHA